jgi:hypothetical protein
MRIEETKFILGNFWRPIRLAYETGRIFFLFEGFNKLLNAEIKMMSGHQWHGYEGAPLREFCIKNFRRDKIWSVKDNQHNAFHIAFLQGMKPYTRYKRELIKHVYDRPLYVHQTETSDFILTRRQCIVAEDMGIGKTLAEITAREAVNPESSWYVAPKSALKAVEREFAKWRVKHRPELMTYQGLVSRIKKLEGTDLRPPQWITLDEAHCVKTPTTQRSEAAQIICDAVREYWGDDAYVVLMTGTPSPKSPLDWWMLCEIACPGFLIEGDIHKLRNRLAIIVQRDFGNGVHPHVAAWKDRDDICDVCGKTKDDPTHDLNPELAAAMDDDAGEAHEFKLAKNEVAFLSKRIVDGGLAIVKFKRDCLDLPDKRYEKVELTPTKKLLQLARMVAKTAPSVAEALTRLRTLSDGFQYEEEKCGEETCPHCGGTGEKFYFKLKDEFEAMVEEGWTLPPRQEFDDSEIDRQANLAYTAKYFDQLILPCVVCKGKKVVDIMRRETKEISCPKDEALKDLIELHGSVGRLVVYAGFTGSVERCVRLFKEMEWDTIKWDGHGIACSIPGIDPLELFQEKLAEHPRVGFIGQPGAAGMGLTLTASPSCIYFSNTFNAVDRLQSEDRIHRLGITKCPTIYDLFHLPTDRLVYNNIEEKRARQDLSMGVDVSMADVLGALHGAEDN